jgi:hypothetical protein
MLNKHQPTFPLRSAAALLSMTMLCAPIIADEVQLQTGGKVHGDLVNRRAEVLDLSAGNGIIIRIPSRAVETVVVTRAAEAEYQTRLADTEDTVDAWWELAQWCQDNYLADERRAALRRIVELQPSHGDARRGLGYQFHRGEWVIHEEQQNAKGMIRYQGRWRSPQEVALMEERKKQEALERDWRQKLLRWRKQIAKGDSDALEEIRSVKSRHAVVPLTEMLSAEPFRAMKFVYLETLGKIGSGSARASLINASMNDPDEEIFYAALRILVREGHIASVNGYLEGLKDQNNVRVNRAAIALGQLGNTKAVGPLIDSLVTTHTVVYVPPGRSSPDSITSTFSSGGNLNPVGGTGMSTGDAKKVFEVQAKNPEVLAALIKLTDGVSFGFDRDGWLRWWEASQDRLVKVKGRRD